MASYDDRIVSHDCPATVVPSGESIFIPAGATVSITHRLGGNFTVLWAMGMARISGANANAIGETVKPLEPTPASSEGPSGPPDEQKIWDQLKTVYDPEIPVNIVDLGLVYSLDVVATDEPGRYRADVQLTLTAPGCGMGPAIAEDARMRAMEVPGITEANVELVWDPPWNQDMISEEGKMELGLI